MQQLDEKLLQKIRTRKKKEVPYPGGECHVYENVCRFCGENYSDREMWRFCERKHAGYECRGCDQRYQSLAELKQHGLLTHGWHEPISTINYRCLYGSIPSFVVSKCNSWLLSTAITSFFASLIVAAHFLSQYRITGSDENIQYCNMRQRDKFLGFEWHHQIICKSSIVCEVRPKI